MRYHIDTGKVVWRSIAGEMVLLNLDTGHYYGLNKTGTAVWSMLCAKKTIKEAVERISRKYSVSLKEAHEDIATLVKSLEMEGIISKAKG